jgi:integrase
VQREITDTWLRSQKPPQSGRLEVWDTRARGLVLRVTPAGAVTWAVRARTKNGKRTRAKLGVWPAVGIAEARKRALAVLAVIHGGGDPVATRRALQAEREASLSEPTVSARLEQWQQARRPEWSRRYAAEVARLCAKEIEPKLGRKALSATIRQDWTEVVAAKHRRAPGTGAWLYGLISSFLSFAEAHGWIAAPLLPRKGGPIIAPRVASRQRALSDEELLRIWHATDALSPKGRAYVRLSILTTARQMEVADIAVGEIDRGKARWAIPRERAKNRQAITLPLDVLALAELSSVWPAEKVAPTYRLLGDIEGHGLRGFSRLKRRVDALSGVDGWCWHDLRRTARTCLTRLGIPRDHAEAALNHIGGQTALERTYDRHDYAPEVIAALSRWQAHVARLVAAAPAAEVIPIRASR